MKIKLPAPIRRVINKYDGCKECELHKTVFHYVWYRGDAPCEVLFIGEAPGKNENLTGQPFIGRSGDLLDKLILRSEIDFTYGITNIICCIPKKDDTVRPPTKEEAAACGNRLIETINAANPKLIILLGKIAKKYLPKLDIPVMELKHPAYILRKGGKNSLEFNRALLDLRDGINGIKEKEG